MQVKIVVGVADTEVLCLYKLSVPLDVDDVIAGESPDGVGTCSAQLVLVVRLPVLTHEF